MIKNIFIRNRKGLKIAVRINISENNDKLVFLEHGLSSRKEYPHMLVLEEEFAKFGFAQKFVSMSFKYMYCFDNSKRGNFKFCKLPLDKYTISWYRQKGDKELIKQFKDKKFAWSEISEDLYNEIQDNIDSILSRKCKYQIKCSDKTAVIVLPENKIEVEFIVWAQEKLNEVYREIIKYKDYYDRLGINKN